MSFVQRLPLVLLAFVAIPSCQSVRAAHAADTPRMATPSVEIEVEDRAPGSAPHVARFNVSLSDGQGSVLAYDGDAKYAVEAHSVTTAEPKLSLSIRRHDRVVTSELDVHAAIPQQPGTGIVLARIDRADGRTTTIAARAR